MAIVKGKLNNILTTMTRRIRSEPGAWARTSLGHGLAISMTIYDGQLCLYLSRGEVYPSESEWITVINSMDCAYFPYQKKKWNGRYYLYAKLPIQESLPL